MKSLGWRRLISSVMVSWGVYNVPPASIQRSRRVYEIAVCHVDRERNRLRGIGDEKVVNIASNLDIGLATLEST